MSPKIFIYILVTFVVIWAMDSININHLFKKNKVYQARTFYFLIAIVLIYLITNFIYDFFFLTQSL